MHRLHRTKRTYSAGFRLHPRRRYRHLFVERLEDRIFLAGDALAATNAAQLDLLNSSFVAPTSPQIVAGSAVEVTPAAEGITAASAHSSLAAQAINQFAFDLYRNFQGQDGNLFLSPMSIATALAMTYAGARGETAAQMADVLHFGSGEGVHDSFDTLLDILNGDTSGTYELGVANALWPQEGFPFRDEFLSLVKSAYDGGSQAVDYIGNAEAARGIINAWVEGKTHDKIKDLISQGALDETTRMVLTNAIYFKGQWATAFDPALTRDGAFHLTSGQQVDVSMMFRQDDFRYCEQDGFQVLEMPYKGDDLSMVILLPQADDGLVDISGSTLAKVNDWLAGPTYKQEVILRLPKFKTTVSSSLGDVLAGMGMANAFDPDVADLTGMAPRIADGNLFIDKVLHKAFVEVNEEGTEAAAATAVIGRCTCFAAGTPVLVPGGERPIEEIRPGDSVLARNERNVDGPVEVKRVEEVFVRQGPILELHVAGQVVRTTAEHPFYVQAQGWTAAGELKSGDLLATAEGQWAQVDKVVQRGQIETVYNMRVADHHTYFVGGVRWGFALWAHNSYFAPPVLFTADHPFHYFIRDNRTGTVLFMGRVTNPLQQENQIVPEVEEEPVVVSAPTTPAPSPPIEQPPVTLPPVEPPAQALPAPPALPDAPAVEVEPPATTVDSPAAPAPTIEAEPVPPIVQALAEVAQDAGAEVPLDTSSWSDAAFALAAHDHAVAEVAGERAEVLPAYSEPSDVAAIHQAVPARELFNRVPTAIYAGLQTEGRVRLRRKSVIEADRLVSGLSGITAALLSAQSPSVGRD